MSSASGMVTSRPMETNASGITLSLVMDVRLGVAVVGDLVERDVAEPAGRLAGDAAEPDPVLICVGVDRAVRLDDRLARHKDVVQAAPVDAPVADGLLLVSGEPLPGAVPSRRVKPVWIVL